ncbi:MAG: hypothetical protein JXB42_00295 [Deltaproteobacteria bacterium]|nr:hypothetical protein [Deltaproteobacteria bacterium]
MEVSSTPVFGVKTAFRSENPLDSVWEELNLLSDPVYLRKAWPQADGELILYTCFSIQQAHEYFLASKYVTYATKPLLLYYCFLNLAKAALAMKNDKVPKGHHGLSNPKYEDQIVDCCMKTNAGVFDELNKATASEISIDEEVSAGLFSERAIELLSVYERIYGKKPSIITPKIGRFPNEVKISVDKSIMAHYPSLEDILVAKLSRDFEKIETGNSALIFKNKSQLPASQDEAKALADEIVNRYVLYSVLHDKRHFIDISDRRISQESCYFALMFLLGSAVRYAPSTLHDWLYDLKKSNRSYLERVCNTAARVFPNLMLNLIYGDRLKYAPSFL